MKWVTYKALYRSEVKYSHKNCKALALQLLKACVKATHSNKGSRNWSSTPHTEGYNKDKRMCSWMLGIKSYFFLGADSSMQLHAAFVKMRLEMIEIV